MLRKLRIKLIAVVTVSVFLIFGAVIAAINIALYTDSARQTEDFIRMIADNDGFMIPWREAPSKNPSGYGAFSQDDMRARRFFYVKTDAQGDVIEADFSMMFDFTASDAKEYVAEALKTRDRSGMVGYFNFTVSEKEYGRIIVFAERRIEMGMLSRLTSSSLAAAGASCVVLLGLSVVLSRWMVRPVREAFDKQRVFMSDASHELRTPLTIISANVDILEREQGTNQRLEYVRTQLSRMGRLISSMLELSRAGEEPEGTVHVPFLSRAMLSTALEFESRAFEEERDYTHDIQEGVSFTGDEERLKSLLSILIDNAIRHSSKGSSIEVTMRREAGRVRISVRNTGEGIADQDMDRVFDRFYRSDASRSRDSGGYGLGLSIARAIVEAHKGKIRASGVQGSWVEFTVTI